MIASPTCLTALHPGRDQGRRESATLPERATLTARTRVTRLPFDGGMLVIEIPVTQPPWVDPTLRALGEILALRSNWDSYGANPVDPHTAAAVVGLCLETMRSDSPAPSIVPTSRGGVQLEWHTRGVDLEVEIASPGSIHGYFEDHREKSSWDGELTFNLRPLFDALAKLSLRE